jgi:hypothetical protein
LARTIAQSFKDWNPHGIAPVIYDENHYIIYGTDYNDMGECKEPFADGCKLWEQTIKDISEGFSGYEKMSGGYEIFIDGKPDWKFLHSEDPEYIELERKLDKAWKLLRYNFMSFWD